MKEIYLNELSDVQTTKIGKGTKIWQYVVILENAIIGDNCNINAFCFIENDVVIGNNVTIKSGVQIWDGAIIEDDVFIGPNVTFTNDLFPRSKSYPEKYLNCTVKKGASIGANTTILPDVIIGECALVGASSLVTKDVKDYSLFMGNPAKFVAFVCKCGLKLDAQYFCARCGIQYRMEEDKLSPYEK